MACVLCTFDLKGASTSDCEQVYRVLRAFRLNAVLVRDTGARYAIPTTTMTGTIAAVDTAAVAQQVSEAVEVTSRRLRLEAEIFVVAAPEGYEMAPGEKNVMRPAALAPASVIEIRT